MSSNEPEVINLVDDDDDEDQVMPSYDISTRTLADGCIEILDSDDDPETEEEDAKPKAKSVKQEKQESDMENSSPNNRRRRRSSSLTQQSNSSSNKKRKKSHPTDDVEIVAAPVRQPVPLAAPAAAAARNNNKNNNNDDDKEIELVGSVGINALVDFPHARENCVQFQFRTDPLQHCPNCYCYVCDVPALHCQTWQQHCQATYTNPFWKRQRERKQQGLPSPPPPPPRGNAATNVAAQFPIVRRAIAITRNVPVKTLLDAVTRVYPAERSPPPPFRTDLRHYQKQSLAFMMDVEESGTSWSMKNHDLEMDTRGGWICSEVGMGKSAIVIALVAAKPQNLQNLPKLKGCRRVKATVIMTSVSLMGQWEDECKKHAPHLKVVRYHPSSQNTKATCISKEDLLNADIIISSATFKWNRHGIDLKRLFFHRVVMDESHLFYSRASSAKVCEARDIPGAFR